MSTQMGEHARSALDTPEQSGVIPDLAFLHQLRAIPGGGDLDPA